MENLQQVEEIRRFKDHLCSVIGKEIPPNIAAWIWIKKYARIWRLRHPVGRAGVPRQVLGN